MKKYKFILKPLFFIFNLLFATWLVFEIEKISPSDFGKYKSIFEDPPTLIPCGALNKQHLKKICIDYKSGLFDSVEMEKRLDKYLATPNKISTK